MGSIGSLLSANIFTQTTSTSQTQQSGSSDPFAQLMQQLGSDLNSNNLGAAQTDFSQLEQTMQGSQSGSSSGSPGATTGHHHHHGGGGGGISQLMQQIDTMLSSAQSDSSSSSTTTSASAASSVNISV